MPRGRAIIVSAHIEARDGGGAVSYWIDGDAVLRFSLVLG